MLRQIVVHLGRNEAGTIFVNILETAVDKTPPYEAVASITFHFLSVVRMVLCVKKDAWPGEMLRMSAQVSLMLV